MRGRSDVTKKLSSPASAAKLREGRRPRTYQSDAVRRGPIYCSPVHVGNRRTGGSELHLNFISSRVFSLHQGKRFARRSANDLVERNPSKLNEVSFPVNASLHVMRHEVRSRRKLSAASHNGRIRFAQTPFVALAPEPALREQQRVLCARVLVDALSHVQHRFCERLRCLIPCYSNLSKSIRPGRMPRGSAAAALDPNRECCQLVR